jgi:large subunit ribosomal protein L21
MEYAIIETGGKQYKVTPGMILEVDRLSEKNDSILFEKVLLHVNGEELNIGKPYISGFAVSAKVLEEVKGDKIRVARFLAKSRHRKVTGFRANLTKIEIKEIVKNAKKDTKQAEKDAKNAKATKVTAKKSTAKK